MHYANKTLIFIYFNIHTILVHIYYYAYLCSMANKKLQKLLNKTKGKTMYGISKVLDISPQAGAYIVKEKDLTADYIRLKKIAEYLECDIEDILDL